MTSTNTPPPWTHIDPLGEALHFLRMSGVFYCRSEFSAPWGLALPPMPDCMMLHVVANGRAWLEVDGELARALAPGDLAIVPRGTGHRLTSQPGVACAGLFDLPRELMSERYEVLRHGGSGEPAQMICAAVRFGHPAAQRLAEYLVSVPFAAPNMPVINNVDVATACDEAAIKDALARQACNPVRWVEVIQHMARSGITHVGECGPGKVLAGMTKRIEKVDRSPIAPMNAPSTTIGRPPSIAMASGRLPGGKDCADR